MLCVVCAHAVAYRYDQVQMFRYPRLLAGPLSEIGVQLFFVISGFIITSLLLKEEARDGNVSIAAFYIRRTFRIIPPFFLMIAFSSANAADKVQSATFTCNIADCSWSVAHSWSLAVEEQYYLIWPMIFVALKKRRTHFVLAAIAGLLTMYLVMPFTYHANALSFGCIATGALAALRPEWRPRGTWWAWISCLAILVAGPLLAIKFVSILTPFLIAYVLFGAKDLTLVRNLLESAPIQWIGLCSYSLYLWQQAFLGKDSTLPLALLPVVVIVSKFIVEDSFNSVGHRLSGLLLARKRAASSLPDGKPDGIRLDSGE